MMEKGVLKRFREKSRPYEEAPTEKLSAITGRRTTAAGAKDHRWRAVPKNISGGWAVFGGGSTFGLSGGSQGSEFNRGWKIRNNAWIDHDRMFKFLLRG